MQEERTSTLSASLPAVPFYSRLSPLTSLPLFTKDVLFGYGESSLRRSGDTPIYFTNTLIVLLHTTSGTVVAQHNGNQQFRHLVSLVKDRFVGTTVRREKRMIAMSIIQTIQTLTPPGRFLIASDNSMHGGFVMGHKNNCGGNVNPLILQKTWILADRDKALSKVLHRLRDKDSRFSKNESTTITSSEDGSAQAGPSGMSTPSTNEDQAKLQLEFRQSADLALLSAPSPNTPVFNSLDRDELALLVSFRQTQRAEERRKGGAVERKAGPEDNNFESASLTSSQAPTQGSSPFFLAPPGSQHNSSFVSDSLHSSPAQGR